MRVFFFFLLLFVSSAVLAQAPELVISKSHNEAVYSLASSADGKLLASAASGETKFWNLASGLEVKSIKGDPGIAHGVFSVPGYNGIGVVEGRAVKLYEGATLAPRVVGNLPGVNFVGYPLAVSPDGRWLFVRGFDMAPRSAVLYKMNLRDGSTTEIHRVKVDVGSYAGFDYAGVSGDGKYLYANLSTNQSAQPTHFLTDLSTGKLLKSWRKDESNLYRFIKNGELMEMTRIVDRAVGSNTTFTVLSLPDLAEKRSFKLTGNFTASPMTPFLPVPGSDRFFVASTNQLLEVNYVEGRLIQTIDMPKDPSTATYLQTYTALLMPGGERMVVSHGDWSVKAYYIRTFDVSSKQFSAPLGASSFEAKRIRRHPTKNIFALTNDGTHLKFFSFTANGLNVVSHNGIKANAGVWSPDGTKVAYLDNENKKIGVFSTADLTKKPATYSLGNNSAGHLSLAWSADSRWIAAGGGLDLRLIDVASMQVKLTVPANIQWGSGAMDWEVVTIAPNGRMVCANVTKPDPKNPRDVLYSIVAWELPSGKVLWETPGRDYSGNLRFTSDGATLLVLDRGRSQFLYLNAATGKIEQTLAAKDAPGFISGATINSQGSEAIIGTGRQVFVRDLLTKAKPVSITASSERPEDFAFFTNPNFFIGTYADNSVHVFDSKKGKEVARIISYLDNNDWVAVNAQSQFEGTEGALKKMYYVKSGSVIPLESLYEKFFSPKLLNKVLTGVALEPPPVNIVNIKKAPQVKIEYKPGDRNLVVEDDKKTAVQIVNKETAIIKLTGTASDDVVQELRLYHNGKLTSNTARNLVVEDEGKATDTRTYEIQLVPGLNTFRAVAINSQRTESVPEELQLTYRAPQLGATDPKPEGPTLHLMVVGINAYKNPKYSLNYAKADATSFKGELEKATPLFKDIKVSFITDGDALKGTIQKTFQQTVKAAKPQDVFVFYYAGHGVMSEGGAKEFYIVPHDVTQLYGADDALAQKGISAKELQEFSKAIPAQKQLFILDACQSAGALNVVAMRGAAEEKAIAQLARSTGTHWLTASGSEQFATEFSQLGHGVFTYALLEGLKGAADNGDKRITINELKAYLETQVPELTQKYKGTAQYPASYGFGNDFPLLIAK